MYIRTIMELSIVVIKWRISYDHVVGPVSVVSQVCSEMPTTDVRSFTRPMGTPAISEPQCDSVDTMSAFGVKQSAEPYKCNFGDEPRCYCSSEQSTEPSQQLIAAPFHVPQQHGIYMLHVMNTYI